MNTIQVNQSSEKIVTIKNKLGFHARVGVLFVNTASRFKSHIYVKKLDQGLSWKDGANGKSLLSLLNLGVSKGEQIVIKAEGNDAQEALNELVNLVEQVLVAYENNAEKILAEKSLKEIKKAKKDGEIEAYSDILIPTQGEKE